MKKIIPLLLLTGILLTIFGCSSKSKTPISSEAQEILREGETLQSIVEQIAQRIEIQSPGEINGDVLKEIYHIPLNYVDDFYGVISLINFSADNVIIVKAKDNRIDDVIESLNTRKQDVIANMHLPTEMKKAEEGVVVSRGNYIMLFIGGKITEEQKDKDNQNNDKTSTNIAEETLKEQVQSAVDIFHNSFVG